MPKTTNDTTSRPSKKPAPRTKRTEAPAPERALAAITEEDLEFERKLQAVVVDEPDIERAPAEAFVKPERTAFVLLRDVADEVAPAKTYSELLEQAHMAKELGADSVEATHALVRQLTLKSGFPKDVGYFWFHDVRVWADGMFETHATGDKLSIDEKVFGKSKIKLQPIMDIGERQK